MKNTSSIPPIASPHGEEAREPPSEVAREFGPIVSVRLSLESAFRYAYTEITSPASFLVVSMVTVMLVSILLPARPFSLLFSPLPFSALILFVLCFLTSTTSTLGRLVVSPRFEVEISSDGICKHYPKRDIVFSWSKFVWILELNGDLWLASFADGCFIPRESFATREQGRTFARFARQLHQTEGAAWSQTFGAQDDDLNNPR